jgi:fused signal recognition particle receptor
MFRFLKRKLTTAVKNVTRQVEEEEPKKEDYIEIKEPQVKEGEGNPVSSVKEEAVKEVTEVLAKEELKQEIEEKGFVTKLREKVTTKRISPEKFDTLFEEIQVSLLENNVALDVVDKIKADLKEDLLATNLQRGKIEAQILDALKTSLKEILTPPSFDLLKVLDTAKKEERPAVILIIGFNGAGKSLTTTKLAYYLKQKGYKPVLSAADTFRSAGRQQTQEYGKMADIPVITDLKTNDSCSVIFDTIKHAKSQSLNVVVADTSGRVQNNQDLMDELKKIARVNNPDVTLLVVDSLTGSDVVTQVDQFDKAIAIDGLILTKVDVDEKGGAFLSAVYTSKKPVLFLGCGQRIEDFKEYNLEEILSNLGFN